MRAYHIMMFLLIFNLMIWAVDAGLGIYDINFSGIDPELAEQEASGMGVGDEEGKYTGMGLLATVAGYSIRLVVISLVAAAIISGIVKVKRGTQAVVYGAFTAVFWTSYTEAAGVLWSMTSVLASTYGALVVLVIITSIVGYVFIVGLFQMVTGGWKSYV